MSMILMATGNVHLGRTRRDKDGNVIEKTNARFEYDPDGGSVIVGLLDPETMEQVGSAEPFGNWDAAGYLARALELLQPNRPVNIPDFKATLQRAWAVGDGNYFCEYCHGVNCRDCIVREWKDEQGDK